MGPANEHSSVTVTVVASTPGYCDPQYAMTHTLMPLKYRLQGERENSISYLAYEREDGWWACELYQFTTDHRTVDLQILFENSISYLAYEEPVEITDRDVKILKRTRIPLVRVRWDSHRGLEYTWEREDQMKLKYPQLFKKSATTTEAEATAEFRDEIPNQQGDDVTPQENQETNAT